MPPSRGTSSLSVPAETDPVSPSDAWLEPCTSIRRRERRSLPPAIGNRLIIAFVRTTSDPLPRSTLERMAFEVLDISSLRALEKFFAYDVTGRSSLT